MKKCTKREFNELFMRGLGKALIVLSESENIEQYKEIVLRCCLRNTAYDQQSEGVRREYIFEAIKKFDDIYFFENAILEKFKCKMTNHHLFDLLSELLFAFAMDGSVRAKNALKEMYKDVLSLLLNKKQYRCGKYYPQGGYLERLSILLIQMGDFSDFKSILSDLKILIGRHDRFNGYFDWLFSTASGQFGKQRTLKAIAQTGINYEPYERQRKGDKVEVKPSINELIVTCRNENSTKKWRLAKYAKLGMFSEDEIKFLAETLLVESDCFVKARMLWAFKFFPFPLDVERLIEYSKSENSELRKSAFEALYNTKNEVVRNYALELLKEGKSIESAIYILAKNFKKSDSKVLDDAIKSLKIDYDTEWHRAFNAVLDLINKNNEAPKELLYYLYEKTLCSVCREFIIKTMEKKKLVNLQLLQELKLDCNFDIREYAYRLERRGVPAGVLG